MIDWALSQTYEIVKTLIVAFASFVLGMWYFNKYVLPKMLINQGSNMLKNASEDPNMKEWVDRGKHIIEEIEEIIVKIKKVDFEKIAEDVKPFIAALKRVNPEDVDAFLKSLKDLTGTIRSAIEKPDIPPPKD